MRSKFTTFILFLIMMILLVGVIFFAILIYIDLTNSDTIQTVHTSNTMVSVEENTETKNENINLSEALTNFFFNNSGNSKEEEHTYSTEKSSGKYFYEQLTDTQKILYNGLQENKDKLVTGTYKIEYGNKFSNILTQENGGDILGDDYQAAIDAFTHDNIDLFYLNVNKLYLNMETIKKAFTTTYNVYIAPKNGETYFNENFKTEAQVRAALNKIEKERDKILQKKTGNAEKDIKIIHDYLIDSIEYDENSESIGTYTIYGALIDKKCVCEGYARSFKYLADEIGIPCVFIQGTATNSEGVTERHAWNAVQVEGKWYYIDTTWDDPIIVGSGILTGNVNYKYYLKGRKTFEKDHVIENRFTENGKRFSFPTVSSIDY